METLTPDADIDTATTLTPEVIAQVLAALRQPVPPDSVRERFGLSTEQFREVVREQKEKVFALLDRWQTEDAAGVDEKEVDIDTLLRAHPLSLREFSVE